MNNTYMDLHGIFLCEKKSAPRSHTEWLHIHDISEMTEFRNGEQVGGCLGVEKGQRMEQEGGQHGYKDQQRDLCGVEAVQHLVQL